MTTDRAGPDLSLLHTAADYFQAAKSVLDPAVFDFIAGGAGDESTCQRNRAALDAIRLSGRVLRTRLPASTACSFAGLDLSAPIAIAPMAYHALVTEDAELATARAAAALRMPFIVSTMSTTRFPDLARTGAQIWFQLYMMRDADLSRALVAEAVKHGCRAIVLTVDVPVFGRRLRDLRHDFRVPAGIVRDNKVRAQARARFDDATAELPEPEFVSRMFKLDLDWDDVRIFCEEAGVPVILKGILHPDDATMAKDAGAAGIVVSNHGGRQFDAHPATIDALAKVRAAEPDLPIGVDGGFRSGTDVLRGLTVGGDLVLLGRTVMYALAAGGEPALRRYLDDVQEELRRGMTLCGVPRPENARELQLL